MNSVIDNQRDQTFFYNWEHYKCVTDVDYLVSKIQQQNLIPQVLESNSYLGDSKNRFILNYNKSIRALFPDKLYINSNFK